MGSLTSSLTVKLVDDVTKPAKSVAQALEDSEKKVKAVAKAMANTGATDRFTASLAKLKLSARDIDKVSASWKQYAASAKLAGSASDWTKAQASGVRRWESQTISALRAVEREQAKFARASKRAMAEGGHGGMTGRQLAAGIVGGAIAHGTAHFARHSLETYREFDKERRYGKAVMAISDDDQEALIKQAIHGGATSKFNDIQWLEAQRELAARGLSRDQVLGITPVAASLGQAMDKSLPEASRLLDGGIFGFGKDVSTLDKARAAAKRTADLQVKAAKISGMNAEDVQQAYKYAAGPSRMAGLSEEQMLAIAAVGKKANMGGDEMGTAIRALSAALLKPTAGARTAMLAKGINYSDYQKFGPQAMQVGPFAQDIATRYGVALSEKAQAALKKVFDDRGLVQHADKFMPAVMKVLAKELGGDDAKSKSKIAGAARGYRDAAMSGVDTQRLLAALLPALRNNPSLANLLFGSKQGGRLGQTLSANELIEKLDALVNHSDGYAQKISDERMAGFDGAVSRFEGAVKNLESALPRAFDNEGKGGVLTGVSDKIGAFVQSLAEAPPQLQRLGVEAGAAAAIFAGMKGAEALLGGFGLKGSALALTEAAHALMGAAGKQTTGAAIDAAAGTGGGGKGKRGVWKRIGGVLKWVPFVGAAIEAGHEGLDYLHELHQEEFGTPKRAPDLTPHAEVRAHRQPMKRGDNLIGPATTHLTEVKATADAAKASLDGLNTTVAPAVDTSALKAALADIQAVLAGLNAISGAARGAASAAAGIKVPALGPVQRGNFSFGGVKGE